jgi:hypothetical protein
MELALYPSVCPIPERLFIVVQVEQELLHDFGKVDNLNMKHHSVQTPLQA